MSLLLALEEESLAACPLNTMMRRGPEAQTRKMLNLPEYENLVMYIAVGHYPEVIKPAFLTGMMPKILLLYIRMCLWSIS